MGLTSAVSDHVMSANHAYFSAHHWVRSIILYWPMGSATSIIHYGIRCFMLDYVTSVLLSKY